MCGCGYIAIFFDEDIKTGAVVGLQLGAIEDAFPERVVTALQIAVAGRPTKAPSLNLHKEMGVVAYEGKKGGKGKYAK